MLLDTHIDIGLYREVSALLCLWFVLHDLIIPLLLYFLSKFAFTRNLKQYFEIVIIAL